MKRRSPKSTPWVAALWERKYRSLTIWVDRAYATSPQWEFQIAEVPASGGRAKTKLLAMRSAESAVDKYLDEDFT